MMFELSLQLRATEGALLRVLGAVERRGFTLSGIVSQQYGHDMSLRLRLETNGRSAQVLLRQLRKLHDVIAAELGLVPCVA
jgi:acetolactate synthase II small subunit